MNAAGTSTGPAATDPATPDPLARDPATIDPATPDPAAPDPAATDHDTPVPWAELLAQATLGTGRRPQRVVGTVAGAVLPAARTAEQSVLIAAAALGAARRASTPLRRGDSLPDMPRAPRDRLPIAPPRAMQVLEVILGGEVVLPSDAGPLLQAWLQQSADTGHRVAPTVLPGLLPRIIGGGIDVVTAARAIGVRGRWLADLHPGWQAVTQALLESDPDTLRDRLAGPATLAGAPPRPAALAALRRHDRQAAAAALADLWRRATVSEHLAVLDLVAADLDHDDEPWLEAALADRSAAVARGAATLLGRLPDSRRAGRMAARLHAIAEVTRMRLRRRLVLRRPDPPDPESLRDATEESPAQGTAGWWQAQIIRGAPLVTWQQVAGGVGPAVNLLSHDVSLLGQVADAAALQRDGAWQGPILAALLGGVGLGPADVERLTGPAAVQAERQARTARTAAIARLAGSLPTPWDQQTGRALLGWAMAHP
ncbi:MAG TPA: DUF5691 domain-containing protein, partial [Euzebya sp.]|nr:DUF5691 domain-containing protein [Euzebya sp.]